MQIVNTASEKSCVTNVGINFHALYIKIGLVRRNVRYVRNNAS